jgi:GxxExxY protein
MDTDKGVQDPLTGRILKGCFGVMGRLGHGFAEVIYQRALTLELQEAGIHVDREARFPVLYKGQEIGIFVADLVADRSVIVELKALDAPLQPFHFGQCLNYMRVSAIPTGLVINFGRPRLEWRRLSL